MILNAHSYYSLRYGTLSIEDMLDLAKANNHEVVALTDINNTTGVLDHVRLCRERGLKPIAGAEFRNGDEIQFIAIARNNEGFREINELLTQHNLSATSYPQRPAFENCYVIYPYGKIKYTELKEHEYIGVRLTHLNKILIEKKIVQQKYVILQSSTFKNRKGYEIHKKLRAIDCNLLLSQLESQQIAGIDEYIIPKEKLLRYFEFFPHIIENTNRLLNDCDFEFDFKEIKNLKHFTGNAVDDINLLRNKTLEGVEYRYSKNNQVALARIEKELEIINRLGFASYFLVTWDMIRHSMSNGIYHYGRGSGANSVVAYCLRITDVCPIELDLYFERFLNPKRKSPPDFDIDYSWKDRNHIYDYMFKKYGMQRTSLLGAMVTFQDRSVIREMGKVYGLPKEDIDRLIKNPNSPLNKSELCQEVLSHYSVIANYPSIRSIHAGGILISEKPLTYYTALDMPPKGYQTTQFDMHVAEDIGFEKLDILSQRGLGHIKEAGELVEKNRGIKIDTHQIEKFKQDEGARQQLLSGNTIGCFYVESPAMRGLLKKLKCDNYLTLVAASSIIRPGVAKSGMMKAYIERNHDPSKVKYLHPIMKEQLKETFGVMVYQEDVLKVAHHFGGLDLADADVLRRMMSGKYRSAKHLDEIKDKYDSYCQSQNYGDVLANEVWRQIESFAGYSFAKGHSASYAAESYQSLYLKAHYPLEFIVAVINNFGGFYSTRVYVNEAKKLGGIIHLPCVNKSDYTTTLYGKDIYLGFVHIKSLNEQAAKNLLSERALNGDYTSLENFKLRTDISLEQLIILIRIDALRFTGNDKRSLLWEAHMLYNHGEKKRKDISMAMFETPFEKWDLPVLEKNKLEDAYDEMELLEFPVTLSEFDLLKTNYRSSIKAKDLIKHVGETVKILGNYITYKSLRTSKGDPMAFGTFLDEDGDFFDTTNFPNTIREYPFKGWGVYLILGKVVEEFGFPSIEVHKMAKLPIRLDDRH